MRTYNFWAMFAFFVLYAAAFYAAYAFNGSFSTASWTLNFDAYFFNAVFFCFIKCIFDSLLRCIRS